MKTLLIITSRYPHKHDSISGSFVKSQVDELRKYFKRVVVISTTPYTPKFLKNRRRDSSAREYKYDNVEVYFTRNIILPFENSKRTKDSKGLKSAIKILNNHSIKPDMIHAHYLWPSGFIAMKLSHKYKIPFVVTGHGYDVYDLPFRNKYYETKVNRVLHRADKIITVSQKNKEIMLKLSAPEDKIVVIPNGFDPSIFFPMNKEKIRKKLKLPGDKKIILSVGGLKPIKGHSYLVKSITEVIKHRKDVLFIIVGEGPEREKLEKLIKSNNLSTYCILKGARPHEEVPYWMNACDLFVLPSLNEGVPTVLFEAMGCGKPVIGTKVGGIPDILVNENLGFVVSPKANMDMSKAILNALENNWDKHLILQQSTQYTWMTITELLLKSYKIEHQYKSNND